MKRRMQYTKGFRREVLRMDENTDKSIWELEQDLGLLQGLIHQWQQRHRVNEETETLQPNSEREAEAEIGTQERDILTKANRVFSREQRA